MQEEWKQIEEAPRYYVSNKGRIAYIPRNGKAKYKFAKISLNNNIALVSLYFRNGKHATRSVAKLVATYFIDNPDNYQQVVHINNNPLDNSVTNLEWWSPTTANYVKSSHYVKRHYVKLSHKTKKVDDLFYQALHSIENEYGSDVNCPEYDERLRFLRTYQEVKV